MFNSSNIIMGNNKNSRRNMMTIIELLIIMIEYNNNITIVSGSDPIFYITKYNIYNKIMFYQ